MDHPIRVILAARRASPGSRANRVIQRAVAVFSPRCAIIPATASGVRARSAKAGWKSRAAGRPGGQIGARRPFSAGKRDAHAFARERRNHRRLIADPEQPGTAPLLAPAIRDMADRIARDDLAAADPFAEHRRFGGNIGEQSFGVAVCLDEPRAPHRHAQIGRAVFLQQQPGIAVIEQVQLDPSGNCVREPPAGLEPKPKSHPAAFGLARRPRQPAQFVLAGGEEQRLGGDLPTIAKPQCPVFLGSAHH